MSGAGVEAEQVVLAGWLRKKKNRVHLWDQRYFVLAKSPPRLLYFLKHADSGAQPRGTFDLTDGCFVTDVEEVPRGKGKKPLYVFWVVWPELPKLGSGRDVDAQANGGDVADDDDSLCEEEIENSEQLKTLKKVVHDENSAFKATQRRAEEQIEKHQNYDSYLKNGAKVAAVGAGAVVVGAFTAGIGLIPFMTVFGLAAIAAGGGGVAVAYGYRRPPNSRLVLATESQAEALKWKDAIDDQISTLGAKKSSPPEQVSFKFASAILKDQCSWTVVATHEGMRVLEFDATATNGSAKLANAATEVPRHLMPFYPASWSRTYKICRKAQLRVPVPPESAFLALMENSTTFLRDHIERMEVVQQIDSHSDVLYMKVKQCPNLRKLGMTQETDLCIMRYWCLEEDGTYVISMNSVEHESCPKPKGTRRFEIQAVTTIAPRVDSDVPSDALVTCACEISNVDPWARFVGLDAWLVDGFLCRLVELRAHMLEHRYNRRHPRRLKRSPSRRSLQSKGSQLALESQSSAGEEGDATADALSAPENGGSRRRFLRRRSREDPHQAELTYLRDTISDREQQIAKLEKRIKKEGKKQSQPQTAATRSHDVQNLLIHMQELLEEVDALKAAYAKLAGSPYEPRKSFFSSRGRAERMSDHGLPAANEQQGESAPGPAIVLPGVTMEPISAPPTDPALLRRPSAWQFELDPEDDEAKHQVQAIQDRGLKNAMLVALFVACLSLTMLLTAYFES